MKSACVFLGPTLSRKQALHELDAVYQPPVAQGDIIRLLRGADKPFAIGIIDGYFERVPAVWHKELLWARSLGVHVFGAASMGALRAAELTGFGVVGVGTIYHAFYSGELEDDDEVAITHAGAEDGYRASSDAMVNIRATLKAAERAGVLTPHQRAVLECRAKDTFYVERTFQGLLRFGERERSTCEAMPGFRAFLLDSGVVDQKAYDAIELLRELRACCELGQPPAPVTYSLAHTQAWDTALGDAV